MNEVWCELVFRTVPEKCLCCPRGRGTDWYWHSLWISHLYYFSGNILSRAISVRDGGAEAPSRRPNGRCGWIPSKCEDFVWSTAGQVTVIILIWLCCVQEALEKLSVAQSAANKASARLRCLNTPLNSMRKILSSNISLKSKKVTILGACSRSSSPRKCT